MRCFAKHTACDNGSGKDTGALVETHAAGVNHLAKLVAGPVGLKSFSPYDNAGLKDAAFTDNDVLRNNRVLLNNAAGAHYDIERRNLRRRMNARTRMDKGRKISPVEGGSLR